MTKYVRISSYIRKSFLIYHLATAPIWIFLYMRKIFFSFLSVYLAEWFESMTANAEVVLVTIQGLDPSILRHIRIWGSVNLAVLNNVLKTSVADPDPHVFGPPGSGSGSTSQRYGSGSGSCSGSGSGSFCHHAKTVRKTLIPTILRLFLTFCLWKMM